MKILQVFLALAMSFIFGAAISVGIGTDPIVTGIVTSIASIPIGIATQGALCSTTAGVFSETLLQKIRATAARIGFDDRIKQQYIPQADILKFIREKQTANVSVLESKSKHHQMEVEWINTCQFTEEDNVACAVGGSEPSTNTKSYDFSRIAKSVGFSVEVATGKTNDFDFEELMAKSFLQAKKKMIESYAEYTVAVLNNNAGVNVVTDGKGTVVGDVTTILAAYWNPALIAYLTRIGIVNRFTNASLITGKNLFEPEIMAMMNQGNADGKGDIAMINALNLRFDLFNIDTVNDPTFYSYLISQGSVALINRADYTSSIFVGDDFRGYMLTGADLGFPELEFDVIHKITCGTGDLAKHEVKVKLLADMVVNPTGCTETNTGILRFACA